MAALVTYMWRHLQEKLALGVLLAKPAVWSVNAAGALAGVWLLWKAVRQ